MMNTNKENAVVGAGAYSQLPNEEQRPTAEERAIAQRYWPVDWHRERGCWRLKISGFWLADADTPEEAFRLGRIALAAYAKVPHDHIPKHFTREFVHLIANCYRKSYADHSKRSEAKFWEMLQELEWEIRAWHMQQMDSYKNN